MLHALSTWLWASRCGPWNSGPSPQSPGLGLAASQRHPGRASGKGQPLWRGVGGRGPPPGGLGGEVRGDSSAEPKGLPVCWKPAAGCAPSTGTAGRAEARKGRDQPEPAPGFLPELRGLPLLPAPCPPQHRLVPDVLFPKESGLLLSTRGSRLEVPPCTDWAPHPPDSLTDSWQAAGPCRGKGCAQALARGHTQAAVTTARLALSSTGSAEREAIYSSGCPHRQLPGLPVKCCFLWLRNWVLVRTQAFGPVMRRSCGDSVTRGCGRCQEGAGGAPVAPRAVGTERPQAWLRPESVLLGGGAQRTERPRHALPLPAPTPRVPVSPNCRNKFSAR